MGELYGDLIMNTLHLQKKTVAFEQVVLALTLCFVLSNSLKIKLTVNRDIHIALVNLQKAHEGVPFSKLCKVLGAEIISLTLISAIITLHNNTFFQIKLGKCLTNKYTNELLTMNTI